MLPLKYIYSEIWEVEFVKCIKKNTEFEISELLESWYVNPLFIKYLTSWIFLDDLCFTLAMVVWAKKSPGRQIIGVWLLPRQLHKT